MRKTILYFLTVCTLSACVYPFKVDLEEELGKHLVIDGVVLLGNTSTITLGYLEELDLAQQVHKYSRPAADVSVEEEDGRSYFASGEKGVYKIPPFYAPEGKRYRLKVVCEGKTYYSDWVEPVNPPTITDVSISADEKNVYVKMSMEDSGNGYGYAAVQFEEYWRFHTDYIKMFYYDERFNKVGSLMNPDMSFYKCWKKNNSASQSIINYLEFDNKVQNYTVQEFLRINNRNHEEYHIRVKLWNLTEDQYRYRKLLETNASIGGNLFSPEPGEISGNVYCETDPAEKVYGYVNISRITYKDAALNDRYARMGTLYPLREVAEEDYYDMYKKGFEPVFTLDTAHGPVVGWGEARCYNCVAAGGTLEKPDFD